MTKPLVGKEERFGVENQITRPQTIDRHQVLNQYPGKSVEIHPCPMLGIIKLLMDPPQRLDPAATRFQRVQRLWILKQVGLQ